MLPETRHFKLPNAFAWFANLLGIAYVIVTTILFVFPPDLPVTGSSMNYCVVAFAIVLIISMIQWFVDGRKNFKGPKVEIDDHVLVASQTRDDHFTKTPPEMTSLNGNDDRKKFDTDQA
jgi:choline transport protein